MVRFVVAAIMCVIFGSFAGGPASAKQCRDAHGKFTKCPPASSAPKQCRDAKGKFVKCPAKKM